MLVLIALLLFYTTTVLLLTHSHLEFLLKVSSATPILLKISFE